MHKKIVLSISLVANLAVLFVFKYFNFFADLTGSQFKINVLLPVGISFYTFQAIGYTIDVYRGKICAERNFITYALFVTFFPQLVAGPIERSKNLLPQFKVTPEISPEKIKCGLKLIAWGLFEKIVVADRLAIYVNEIYGDLQSVTGCSIVLATVFFCFQILCDFSGYSNIAIGSARLLGYNLMRNFRNPFLSKSIGELWGRWHTSLSSWFKDYVYIPLGGSRCGILHHYLNLILVMTLSGLWHGASLHFILWGFVHGIFLCVEKILESICSKFSIVYRRINTIFGKTCRIFATFLIYAFFAIGFRASSISEWLIALKKLNQIPSEIEMVFQSGAGFNLQSSLNYLLFLYNSVDISGIKFSFGLIAVLMTVSLLTRQENGCDLTARLPLLVRWGCYYAVVFMLIFYSITEKTQFIYFQF